MFTKGRGPEFVIDESSIPAEIFGLESYQSPINPVAKITRREAIQVPAVKQGRDLIAGTIGTIPFKLIDSENVEFVSTLLDQPERNHPRSITMTRLVEDLVFEGHGFWWTKERDYRNYPTKVVRVDPLSQVDEDGYLHVRVRDKEIKVPPKDYICFESPTDGVLHSGARAIRTYLKLATAADKYADSPMPSSIFIQKPGDVEPNPADVQDFLDDYEAMRRTRSTAYIPAAVDFKTLSWSPSDMQMDQARQHAVIEIARCFGLDPEDMGAVPAGDSNTYQNSQDRRIAKINDLLAMYIAAIAERLSMPDVTPRGYRIVGDFNGFLKANDVDRFTAYQLGVALGIYDRDAIAAREGLPQPTFPMPAPQPQAIEASNFAAPIKDRAVRKAEIENTLAHARNFDADAHVFGFDTDETRNTFAVDTDSRTIYGLAVPYGVPARRGGRQFQFSKGSLAWSVVSNVKLLIQHDRSQAVGKATELTDTDHGLFARFKIARTPEGDRALALAEDGVYDGLSIGLSDEAKFSQTNGINHSAAGNTLVEISLTPSPAFDEARVSAVVAEADTEGKNVMPEEANEATAPQFDMDALVTQLADRLRPTVAPVDGPEVVNVNDGPIGLQVSEPEPYVFDRRGTLRKGAFDFSTDLFAGLKDRDQVAMERVLGFMRHQFDVLTTDVNELSPTNTRPELYVDQKKFRFPLWEAVRKGTLTEITPFIIPKWSSNGTMVAAHTEGVEPTESSFVTTSQTVTPGAVSGKVEITREVFDQGGNPNVSNLIWQKMVQAYNEALEAKVVATLDAATPTGITLTAGGGTTGQTAALELAAAISALQYVRGGFSFDQFAIQIDLYQLLAKAQDNDKRFLFPMLGPVNSDGSAAERFGTMNLFGVTGYPSWALAATGSTPASSYLFDAKDIFAAASAPNRLDFQYRVALVDLAVWGYSVCAITDITGVREVIYDPVP